MTRYTGASQVAQVVKNPPANAGDLRATGSSPGLGRSPEEGMATHSSVLAWRIPWTEKPVGLQSKGSQRVRQDGVINAFIFHWNTINNLSIPVM